MNKVILMGRLTRDPEVRYSQGERAMAIARYTLAVDRRGRRSGGDDGAQTADFIPCVAFDRAGEFAEKYFHQGTKVRGNRKNSDWQLHQQRRSEGIYDRSNCRGSGICREQECGSLATATAVTVRQSVRLRPAQSAMDS